MIIKPIIEVEGLIKAFGNFIAVDQISFFVNEGEIFGLLGPNGAGKTTTLEILETLLVKTAGKVLVGGFDIDAEASHVKNIIGVQLQLNGFHSNLNLLEIIDLFCALYNASHCQPLLLLQKVGLEDKSKSKFKTLSGGQKQRFAIAVALINKPKLLFLDEPTTGLDPHARRNLWELIQNINKEGISIVLTTHYMDEAEFLCNRIGIMNKGKIIAIDSPQTLIQNLLNTGFEKKIEVQKANLEDVFLHLTAQ